jgi:phosphoglycolate phosphatase-like HAD superfamily hydrolase
MFCRHYRLCVADFQTFSQRVNVMNPKENAESLGHIIFDHDGTLVQTDLRDSAIFEGMRELLHELKGLGFELYVWTSRPRKSTQESLKKFDIHNYFTAIYCYDDGLPKPHPMGLSKLTEGFAKQKILHIGDSLSDLEGAKAYNIEVVLACWNDTSQVNKYKHITDYSAHNLVELRSIIKGKFHV